MIVMVVIIFILMALSDFPKLIHDKKWYETTVLAGIYAIVMSLAVLFAAGVTLPSPIKGIQNFIINVLHLGYPKP